MKKLIFFLTLLLSLTNLFSQENPIYGSKVIVRKRDTSSAEFQIINSTRNVSGFLKNTGGGNTIFKIPSQSEIAALPDSLLARYTKTQADARFKSISYIPDWLELTGVPSNFSTTYALSNDIQDSLLNKVTRNGSYANPSWITSLDYSKLTGTVPTWNQNTTGNAATVTNGVYTTGSYANPAWITSLDYSKLTGTVPTWNQNTTGNAATVTNGVYTTGSYADPSWITSLGWSKISGAPAFITGINSSMVTTALGYTPENISNKGIANGYADLDAGGKIPASRIDFGQTGQTFVVASQAAMLAVSGANIGALAIRTDESKNYRLIAQPASTLGNWQLLLSPDAPVQSVNGYTGNVNLLTTHISEGSNYWWTAARSRAAQSLTTTGNSGSATYDNSTGVLNVPTYTLAGLGGISLTSLSFTPGSGGYNSSTGVITIPTNTNQLTNGAGFITGYTEIDPTIYAWAKATVKPSYSYSEITSTPTTWAWASITGIPSTFTPSAHSHGNADITDLAWAKITGAPAFITGNQTITLSGDISGSGTTAITTTIGALKVTNAMLAGSIDYSKMNSATVPIWNQNTTGNAATVTNGVYTTGSYSDPSWITSLVWSKISGAPAFITGINSSMVTTALGYTPYNATNPSGYITSAALTSYLPKTAGSSHPITGELYINSSILNSNSTYLDIYNTTADGSDNKITRVGGGGDVSTSRGAVIELRGNEAASGAGNLYLNAGASGTIIANAVFSGTSFSMGSGGSFGGVIDVASSTGTYSTFKTNDAISANNSGGGFYNVASVTSSSRLAALWLDADGANFSGSDYGIVEKIGGGGKVRIMNYNNTGIAFGTAGTEYVNINGTSGEISGTSFNFSGGGQLGGEIIRNRTSLGSTDSPVYESVYSYGASNVSYGQIQFSNSYTNNAGTGFSIRLTNVSNINYNAFEVSSLGATTIGSGLNGTANQNAANAWHTLRGTGLSDGTSTYGTYGGIILNANNEYTTAARRYLITNGLNATKFAIIRSTDATTSPSLGTAGALTSGTADFVIDNNGSVGIGTAIPSSIFQLNATAGTTHQRFSEAGTTIGFIGGANGLVSGHNGKLMVRGEAGLILSGQGNAANITIDPSTGATAFSNSVLANAGFKAYANSSYTIIDAARGSNFGYSSSYPVLVLGNNTVGTGAVTLGFGVDPIANSSGSFSGNGNEYLWRNTGSFITPNAANTAYNTLFSWNSSGQVTYIGNLNAPGFAKSSSSDSYFLLGGGGHVATSTYATVSSLSSYATTASLSGYVDISNNQYEIGGNKTFLADVVVNGKLTGSRILGNTATYTSAATISSSITTAFCSNSSGSNYTLTMPSASGVTGQIMTVILTSGTLANTVTLSGINGGSYVLTCYASVVLVSDGSTWKIASVYNNTAPCS